MSLGADEVREVVRRALISTELEGLAEGRGREWRDAILCFRKYLNEKAGDILRCEGCNRVPKNTPEARTVPPGMVRCSECGEAYGWEKGPPAPGTPEYEALSMQGQADADQARHHAATQDRGDWKCDGCGAKREAGVFGPSSPCDNCGGESWTGG